MEKVSVENVLKAVPVPAVLILGHKIQIANSEFLSLCGQTEIREFDFLEWLRGFCAPDNKAKDLINSLTGQQDLSVEITRSIDGKDAVWFIVSSPLNESKGRLVFFSDRSAPLLRKTLESHISAAKQAEAEYIRKLEEANKLSLEIERFAYTNLKQTAQLKAANVEISQARADLQKKSDELGSAYKLLRESIEKEKESAVIAARADAEKKRAQELNAANQQLKANEQQLKAANQELQAKEQALRKSQDDLKLKFTEMERLNKFMVGRELDMIKLKKEVDSVLQELGRPPKYAPA